MRIIGRDVIKNAYLTSCQRTRYSRHILMKSDSSRQILEKYSNMKFPENPTSGARTETYKRKDGQTHMTKLTIVFRNF
jgi:hypothetical protein